MTLPGFIPQPTLRTVIVYAVGLALIAAAAGLASDRTPLQVAADTLEALGVETTWPGSVAEWVAQRRSDISDAAHVLLLGGLGFAAWEGDENGELSHGRSRAALTAAFGAALMVQVGSGAVALLTWSVIALAVGAVAGARCGRGRFVELFGLALVKVCVVAGTPVLVPVMVLVAPWPSGAKDAPQTAG